MSNKPVLGKDSSTLTATTMMVMITLCWELVQTLYQTIATTHKTVMHLLVASQLLMTTHSIMDTSMLLQTWWLLLLVLKILRTLHLQFFKIKPQSQLIFASQIGLKSKKSMSTLSNPHMLRTGMKKLVMIGTPTYQSILWHSHFWNYQTVMLSSVSHLTVSSSSPVHHTMDMMFSSQKLSVQRPTQEHTTLMCVSVTSKPTQPTDITVIHHVSTILPWERLSNSALTMRDAKLINLSMLLVTLHKSLKAFHLSDMPKTVE